MFGPLPFYSQWVGAIPLPRLLCLGSTSVHPCEVFGIDRFDCTIKQEQCGHSSFFSWYNYTTAAWSRPSRLWSKYKKASAGLVSLASRWPDAPPIIFVLPKNSVFSGVVQDLVAVFRKRTFSLRRHKTKWKRLVALQQNIQEEYISDIASLHTSVQVKICQL